MLTALNGCSVVKISALIIQYLSAISALIIHNPSAASALVI